MRALEVEIKGGLEFTSSRPVRAYKFGIAERTYRRRAILLAPGPEIASGKTKKERRAAGVIALALQRAIHFFDRVSHSLGRPISSALQFSSV